jgi:hypothetical protein
MPQEMVKRPVFHTKQDEVIDRARLLSHAHSLQ